MPTIAIYVPDELHKQLADARRIKESINVSAVCQAALMVALQMEERAHRPDRMQQVLARLAAELPERSRVAMLAYRAGRAWAEDSASLSELAVIPRVYAAVTSVDYLSSIDPTGERIRLGLLEADNEIRWLALPQSVPRRFFVELLRSTVVVDMEVVVRAFLRAAVDVQEEAFTVFGIPEGEDLIERNVAYGGEPPSHFFGPQGSSDAIDT